MAYGLCVAATALPTVKRVQRTRFLTKVTNVGCPLQLCDVGAVRQVVRCVDARGEIVYAVVGA